MSKRKGTYWNVPVDKTLNEAVEQAILDDWHHTKAEFIRDAVRKALREMGYRPPRPKQLSPVMQVQEP